MKKRQAVGSMVPGGLILGLGIGMLMGETAAGMFIGLGLGIILSGVLGAVIK